MRIPPVAGAIIRAFGLRTPLVGLLTRECTRFGIRSGGGIGGGVGLGGEVWRGGGTGIRGGLGVGLGLRTGDGGLKSGFSALGFGLAEENKQQQRAHLP